MSAPRLSLKRINEIASASFEKHEGYVFEGVMPWVASAIDAATAPLLAALDNISKGEGPYSRDVLTHATNTIEAMKEAAATAVAQALRKPDNRDGAAISLPEGSAS